jgi:hypothetical protein
MKLKELNEAFDLNKQSGKYKFSKPLFLFSIFVMLLLLTYGLYLEDFKTSNYYIKCSENAKSGTCLNPLYICQNPADLVKGCMLPETMEQNPQYVKDICKTGACDKQFLNRGEELGEKPNFIIRNFQPLIAFIVMFTFLINHGLNILAERREARRMFKE